jgi:TRAP-type C4-dicarboxylate transport system substrate-binding protein
MNFDQALAAFEKGVVDGQENPISLIIPYKLWTVHTYIILWHYTIDPLILGVSAKTWATLSPDDRNVVRQAGSLVMELQKEEARDAPSKSAKMIELLRDMYGMEVVQPSRAELDAFRRQTRSIHTKWVEEIGRTLVGRAETIVESGK